MSELETIKWQIEWARENGINVSSNIDSDDINWLVEQAEKLNEVKELVNDERITKGETVDKISKIVNV